MNNCTVIVNSCDKYSDLWFPYFECFKRNWADCPYDIILNTETKEYTDCDLKIYVINTEKDELSDWSSRLLRCLKAVNTDIVLITLDDHFLLQPVDQSRLDKVVRCMIDDKTIASMSFLTQDRNYKTKEFIYGDGKWQRQNSSTPLRVNCQTALWRKDVLERLLCPGENAWEFEGNGTRRAIWDFHKYYRYIGKPNWPAPIIDYAQHVYRGLGVYQGKWLWNNEEFFKEMGISIDYGVRGVISQNEFRKLREERIEREQQNLDWRDGTGIRGKIYQMTPIPILKVGSMIKRVFVKNKSSK